MAVPIPNYEIKFILKPKPVLNRRDEPAKDVREALRIADDATSVAMQFLDDRRATLHKDGKWNVRLRRCGGKDDRGVVELTYKKRYGAEGGLADALAEARNDGFGRGREGGPFECQVEWGLQKRTLTFSLKRTRKSAKLGVGEGGKVSLPGLDNARVGAERTPR